MARLHRFLSDLLLGTDPGHRPRVSQTLLVLLVYAVFAALQQVEVELGMMDAVQSNALTAWNLAGGIGFYALMRSTLAEARHWHRPLAMVQQLWAMVGISWSYGITGAARGAVMLIMLVVVIYSLFSLTTRQTRGIVGAGIAMLGGVMLYKGLTDPLRYDPRVEAFHFIFFAIVMCTCAVLSIRIGKLRRHLERQRNELGDAVQRIQELATCDHLTGLLNRRAALERVQQAQGERAASPPGLMVALIDLDHFKRVNDQHGHAAGDRVLRRFADTARAAVRAGDVLARWGGEEFLLVMPGADIELGRRRLAQLQASLASQPMDDIAPGYVIRFSAGVAACAGDGRFDQAIEAADRAMYVAKQSGRNRVCMPADCATLAVS